MKVELTEEEIDIILKSLRTLNSDDGLDDEEWNLYHRLHKILEDIE